MYYSGEIVCYYHCDTLHIMGAQKICSNDALACTLINHGLKVSIEDLGFVTYKLTIAYINSER